MRRRLRHLLRVSSTILRRSSSHHCVPSPRGSKKCWGERRRQCSLGTVHMRQSSARRRRGASHEKLIISYTIRFLLILFSSLFLHCFRPLEMNVRRRHVHIHISNSFCAARTSQLSLSPPPLSVDSTTCNDLNQDGDFYLIGPTPALAFSDACAKWNFQFYGWTRALCCCCWLKCKKFLLATKYFFNCSLVFRSIPIFPSRREQAAKTTQESGAREFAECRYNIN